MQDLQREPVKGPPKNPFLPPPPDIAFDVALVHLGLSNRSQAIDWLEKACDERTAEIIHLKCEPIYKSIQGEPRIHALRKRIGLEN